MPEVEDPAVGGDDGEVGLYDGVHGQAHHPAALTHPHVVALNLFKHKMKNKTTILIQVKIHLEKPVALKAQGFSFDPQGPGTHRKETRAWGISFYNIFYDFFINNVNT